MKRISLYFIFSLFAAATFAQSPTTSFDVDGIKVIWKPTAKDIVHVTMYYRGGVTNYPAAKAGIENLALAGTVECGTKKYNKDSFKDTEDAYGIETGGSGNYDFGGISMNCISKYFNQGWDLFTEAVRNPVYDAREFGFLKEKVLSGIKESQADPDNFIEEFTVKNAFAGTKYTTKPEGEEATVAALTVQQVKDYYYNMLLNKNRMFIVVVGKFSKEDLIAKVRKSFAGIPAKPYTPFNLKSVAFASNTTAVEERKMATNYITGAFNSPSMESKDYIPYKLAISLFSTRLFREIRTKRNLSYAPYAYSTNHKLSLGIMYVSTTDPKASAEVMMDEVKRLKQQGFQEGELQDAKSTFITNNYLKEESTSAIASSLGNAEILGSWKLADEMPDKVNKTTLKDLNNSIQYIKGIKWSYLGDKKLFAEALPVFVGK